VPVVEGPVRVLGRVVSAQPLIRTQLHRSSFRFVSVGVRDQCGRRGSNPHGQWPPVSETGAYSDSATSAREPQAVKQTGGSSSQAAGRGGCRFDRAASRRACRRDSSTTTLAGRCGCLGRAATRTRCRFISSRLCVWNRPARGRTRTSEVGARRASAYTTGLRKRTARIERASPKWRSGALPTELRPREEPPAGVEPAPRPYKGRVLAVDTTEARWRRRESNPLLLVASEVLCH
jgi:hypothetical protein